MTDTSPIEEVGSTGGRSSWKLEEGSREKTEVGAEGRFEEGGLMDGACDDRSDAWRSGTKGE